MGILAFPSEIRHPLLVNFSFAFLLSVPSAIPSRPTGSTAAMAALTALFVVAATGCRSLRDRDGAAEAAASEAPSMMVPVGTVHLSQAGSGFVLIRTARSHSLDSGTKLVAVNSQGVETAWLEASEARQGSFLSADILGGAPSVGDQVLMEHQAHLPAGEGGIEVFGGGETRQVLE